MPWKWKKKTQPWLFTSCVVHVSRFWQWCYPFFSHWKVTSKIFTGMFSGETCFPRFLVKSMLIRNTPVCPVLQSHPFCMYHQVPLYVYLIELKKLIYSLQYLVDSTCYCCGSSDVSCRRHSPPSSLQHADLLLLLMDDVVVAALCMLPMVLAAER